MDIHAPLSAILSNTSFNAASKRHRPNIKVGQTIICHITSACPHLDVEVSCEDPTTQKDWVTNEVYFGQLPESGLLIDLPLAWCKSLMDRGCSVVSLIGQYLKPFEVAFGSNGRAYVVTADGQYKRMMLIADVLAKAEHMSTSQMEDMCKDFERRLI